MGTEFPEDHHALSLCLLWPTCEGALPTRLYSDCLRGVAQLGSSGALGAPMSQAQTQSHQRF